MFGGTRAVIGLDLGSTAVKAAQVKRVGKRYSVVAYRSEPLPRRTIVNGVVIDSAAVSRAIERLIGPDTPFRAKHVCASLAGNAVIVKRICLPVNDEAALGEAIFDEARRHIPFDIDDINLDFQVLDRGATEPDGTTQILLAAAKKEKVDEYVALIANGGRTASIIDVAAFALQNAYEANYRCDGESVVVLLNVGASNLTVNVLRGSESILVREISIGGDAYTEALQKELGLPYEAAEQLKQQRKVEDATFEQAAPILRAVTETVLVELQQTFDFFQSAGSSRRCDLIMVTGGASRLDGFKHMLQERFRTPVEELDPFRIVRWKPGTPEDNAPDFASTAAVAVGLALRRVGD